MLAKLLNKSKETGKSFQQYLQWFCQEEFIRRIRGSNYADKLVLKGGLLICILTDFESRVTIDIDFLVQHSADSESGILMMVDEIINIRTGNDYIYFEIASTKEILRQEAYRGWSVSLVGVIKNTSTPFSVDFAFGDIVVPKTVKRKVPNQLKGFANAEISTYSLESIIAEKFDAIISRLEYTSRMKDFYDIYYLARMFDFDGQNLQKALFTTLHNRGTTYSEYTFGYVEDLVNSEIIKSHWMRFLSKLEIQEPDFDEVLSAIRAFLKPVFNAIIIEKQFLSIWSYKKQKWTR